MLRYWLWLATRPGLGPRSIRAILEAFPTPRDVYLAQPEDYAKIPGIHKIQGLKDKNLQVPERILRDCQRLGITILTIQDPVYPQRLLGLEDCPPLLYCKGRVPDWNIPVIGVVGTRMASAYGLRQAQQFGSGLSRCGAIVVSGGAKGIDTQALRGALSGGSPVVAVLGCGVDVAYPQENRALFGEIAEHGCLLSEYPPGVQPKSYNFPARNRLISGMSLGVLIVEAPMKSGAMNTARWALDQGRDVFALPANVDQPTSTGNLQLLRDGAILVRSPRELLEEYAGQFPDTLQLYAGGSPLPSAELPRVEAADDVADAKPGKKMDNEKRFEGLDPGQLQLVKLLESGVAFVDDLAEAMQKPGATVLGMLTVLEIKGLVQRLPGQRIALTPPEK